MPAANTSPPVQHASVEEIHATFPNDAALRDAISGLTHAGFHRDRMRLLHPEAAPASANAASEHPTTEPEARQMRTLHSSTAAAAAAMAGAAAVVATGGAALPAVAAAAGAGLAAGGGVYAATGAADAADAASNDSLAGAGRLQLAVTLTAADDPAFVEATLRRAGATDLHRERGAAAGFIGKVAVS